MKVFLSSTFMDLIDYRKTVTMALRRQGLEVTDMETFAARKEEPKEASLSELAKCDVVIGLYAHRYGFIPEGDDISITEREYLHAKYKGIPMFCFLIDKKQPWIIDMVEDDTEKLRKLNAFKYRILKEKVVDFFTTPENLAILVTSSIGRYIHEQQIDLASSRQSIPVFRPYGSGFPTLPYFFGREKELKEIAEAISPKKRGWGVLIDGRGGIGKTALAVKAAQETPQGLFTQKIFITAKVRELTYAGERILDTPNNLGYLTMLNELAFELGEHGILRLIPEERMNALWQALEGQHILIIFDNMETLTEEGRSQIFRFLGELPYGNKAIVTSRLRDDIAAYIIRLDRLMESEARALIAELAKSNPVLERSTELERRKLYVHAAGNPLLITWIAGQLSQEQSRFKSISEAVEFMDNAPENNSPLEYVFSDVLNTLSEEERKILASLTHLGQPANLKWISIMTKLREDIVEFHCENLVTRSILMANRKTKDFLLPTLTNRFVRVQLPAEIHFTEFQLSKYVFNIANKYGGQLNYDGISTLAAEWPAISVSLPFFVKEENNDLQSLCDLLDLFLRSSGLWEEWLWLNQQAEIKALGVGDNHSAGNRAYKCGLIYGYRGQAQKVLEYIDRAKSHWTEGKLPHTPFVEQPFVDYLRGVLCILEKNYEEAIHSIENALTTWKMTKPEGIEVATALNSLAEAQMEYGNTKDSEASFNEAILLAKNINYKEGTAIFTGNLAELALRQNELSKAEDLAMDALKKAREIEQQDEIAKANYRLARALLLQGRSKQALPYAQRAIEVFVRLRHKDLPKAQELFLQCREKIAAGR